MLTHKAYKKTKGRSFWIKMEGFSEFGKEVLESVGYPVLIILAGLAFITLIVALFNDQVNGVLCVVIGVGAMFFIHKFCDPIALMGEADTEITVEEVNFVFVFLWTLVFFVLMLLRFLPCMSMQTEKNTYLILGTLVEETDSRIVGAGVGLGVPILCSVGYFFLSDWLVNNGWYYIGYIAVGFFLLISVIGLIRSFFDY